jgi:four helix bundle protein
MEKVFNAELSIENSECRSLRRCGDAHRRNCTPGDGGRVAIRAIARRRPPENPVLHTLDALERFLLAHGSMPPTDLLKRTFTFACACVELYRHLMKRGGAGRALARQFLDAGTSIGANVEEAQAGASKADFVNKQTTALKEARESHYWLRLFEHCQLGDLSLITPMREESGELVAILTTIVAHAKSNMPR